MQGLAENSLQSTAIDPIGHSIEQAVLLNHVGCLVLRSGKHELPHVGDALCFQGLLLQVALVLDDRTDLPLRSNQLSHTVPVAVRVGTVQDKVDVSKADSLELRPQRPPMIQDLVCPELPDPGD